jgi:hypothetical protein
MENLAMKSIICLLSTLLITAPALADAWDGNDDQTSKPHDLTQGSDEAHDLAARPGPVPDVDWSRVPQEAYSSYEVTIDGVASSVDTLELTRFDATGSTLLQTGAAPTVGGGTSRVLEWKNGTAPASSFVRVQGAACGATCGKDAAYRIRAVETTIAIPRFDNTGTQQTVLFIQNTRPTARSITAYFWNGVSGNLLSAATSTFSVPAHAAFKLPTFINATGASGSVTIAHDAGYGGLVVKAVQTDTATGFAFDTTGSYRPR